MTLRRISWLALLIAACALPSTTAYARDAATAPDFRLEDCHGNAHALKDFRGTWVVLEWVNYDCPFVKKHYDPKVRAMQTLQTTYAAKGVVWLSICSSAKGKQGYMTPAQAAERLKAEGAKPTALLLDPDGKVGRAYGAKTTPDMRLIDPEGTIVYSGAIDSVRSANAADIAGATNYLQQALDAALAGKPVPTARTRPYGCSVKYAAPDMPEGATSGPAPAFTLMDSDGKKRSLAEFKGRWVVLEWTNYDCPFVKKHYDASHRNMQALQRTYTGKGVAWISICSSADGKQGYMDQATAARRKTDQGAAPTALLLDPDGTVGRKYGARTTPEIRIIDPKGTIVYSGAIDSVKSKDPADVKGATNYVQSVLDAVLDGKAPPVAKTRPYG